MMRVTEKGPGAEPPDGSGGSASPRSARRAAALALALCLLPLGCATGGGGPSAASSGGGVDEPNRQPVSGPGQGAPAPAGQEVPDRLRPSDDARMVADTIGLTGRELGSMWTFENPPLDQWEERHGFRPDSAWLEHVRLASLRYGQSCSASFVSPDGLVMTNHHCARSCVESISSGQTDYVEQGFHARSQSEEKLCPDLYLDQLVEIEEVTDRVRAAAPEGADEEQIAEARRSEREAIVDACEEGSDLRCQVVSLYQGGQYQLYKYRRYSPVKLVFAPELQAGFFGGVPDNFAYPRYALDVAFVRAYRPDSSSVVHPDHHFEWDPEGAEEGETVFLTGNPGSTSRMATVSQLLYERAYRHPFRLDFFLEQRAFLEEIARMGPQAEQQVRQQLFQLDNVIELYRGELDGLQDPSLMGQKLRWERRFRDSVRSDPELRREYGDVWDELTEIQAGKLRVSPPLNVNDPGFIGSPHVGLAADLVNYVRQRALPAGERAEGFDEEKLKQLGSRLRGRTRLSAQQSTRLLEIRLRLADRWLEEDSDFRREVLRGRSPEQAARRLIEGSRIGQRSFRTSLIEAGPSALDTVSDPLVRAVDRMIPRHRELEPRWESLTARESVQEGRLAEALFAVFGTDLPPDATFTLRISDGVVKRYPYNGTMAPARTSFHGLYARAEEFGGEDPFTLPHAFEGEQEDLDLGAPLDFVSTNDITGGNSGSPVVDRDGRVVGVAFDGNHEQLPNEFLFRTGSARTISVHSAGITEALRSVYEAERLLEELLQRDVTVEEDEGSGAHGDAGGGGRDR